MNYLTGIYHIIFKARTYIVKVYFKFIQELRNSTFLYLSVDSVILQTSL